MRVTIGLAAFLAPILLVCLAATQPASAQALTTAVDHVAALFT